MTTLYPATLDALTNPVASDSLTGHAAQHTNLNDAVEALQAKVGVDGSVDAASLEYRLRSIEQRRLFEATSNVPIGGHRLVILDALVRAHYANNTDNTHAGKVLGLTTGATNAGDTITVLRSGEIAEPSWNWTLDQPVYLGTDGLLTQTPPEAPAVFSLIVGFPTTATKLFVSLREPLFI